jgi:hypothetical protein
MHSSNDKTKIPENQTMFIWHFWCQIIVGKTSAVTTSTPDSYCKHDSRNTIFLPIKHPYTALSLFYSYKLAMRRHIR